MSAQATPQMRDFVQKRRGARRDDVLEEFLDAFTHEVSDDDAERIFASLWADAANRPSRPVPARRPAPAGRPATARGENLDEAHLTAPYRFVALNETIAPPEPQVHEAWEAGTLHTRPLIGGLSGVLEIAIDFDGPMLIGETVGGEDKPVELDGIPVIPGATLRGLTRATMEIAAFARLWQTNLHRRFSIRDFEHEAFRDEERKKVRAGWLIPDPAAPSGHAIAPCCWWRVRIRDLPGCGSGIGHLNWLERKLEDRYRTFGMKVGATVDFSVTHRFDAPPGDDFGAGLAKPDPISGTVDGVYVFSDASPAISTNGLSKHDKDRLKSARGRERERLSLALHPMALDHQNANAGEGDAKKTEAVFAAEPHGAPIPIDADVWRNFELNNSKPSRRKPEPAGNWAKLCKTVAQGGRIPVFWVADAAGQVDDLGLVRVFKRALLHNVGKVLKRTGNGAHLVDPDAVSPDLVDALFGFVHEPETVGAGYADMHAERHLKGRVGFGFARLSDKTPAKIAAGIETVLSAPKPSFAPFYLAGTEVKDWSSDTVTLAGRKRYPARDADAAAVRGWLEHARSQANDNAALRSKLRFLTPAGDRLCFEGEIRVHNVTAVELGGLIWALTFGGRPERRHMIGRAKNAGAGQARITVAAMRLETNEGDKPPDEATLRAHFEAHMDASVPGWSVSRPVRELLESADPGYGKARLERLRYLPLKNHSDLRKAVYSRGGPAAINRQRPRLLGFD